MNGYGCMQGGYHGRTHPAEKMMPTERLRQRNPGFKSPHGEMRGVREVLKKRHGRKSRYYLKRQLRLECQSN
jgi:hypothetical protein